MKIVTFYTVLFLGVLSAINPKPIEDSLIGSPVLKSLLLPGLGELSIGEKKRAKFFGGLEVALWVLVVESAKSKKRYQSNMVSYAALHAGANLKDKDHRFALDVGNFLSLEDFNQEQQRMRLVGRVYRSDSYNWKWDSEQHREKYWDFIRNRARAHKIGLFVIGGMIANRIGSAINISYLSKLQRSNTSMKFEPLSLDGSIKVSKLIFSIKF